MIKKLTKSLKISCIMIFACIVMSGIFSIIQVPVYATGSEDLIKVEKGQNTLPVKKYQTADLLSAQEAQNDTEKSIKLDYTFIVNADKMKNVHNADSENANNLIGEGQANGTSSSVRYLEFDFRLEVRGQYYDAEYGEWHNDMQLLWVVNSTSYSYYDKSNEYWTAQDFNKWYQPTSKYDFIKFTSVGKDARFNLNATVADLEKAIYAENPTYSQVKIMDISVDAICSYGSSKSFDSGYMDSVYINVIDKHSREADIPDRVWRLTLDKQLEIKSGAPHLINDESYDLTDSDYVAPTNVKYNYIAMFENRGPYYYQDENGDWKDVLVGFPPDDFEGNFFTEINPHDGKTYGFWEGELVKSENTLKLREFVTAQNRVLIMSMIGLKPSGAGGTAMIMLGCNVEFTYADGRKLVVPVRFGHEMTHLVAPCVHACSNCGECTAEEMLECNAEMYYGGADGIRVSECKCGSSDSLTITPIFNDTINVGPEGETSIYNVSVNEISIPNDSEGTYVEALQNIVPNLDVQTIYQVDVTNQENNEAFNGQYPDQVVTITFNVTNEIGQGLENGNLGVVHINTENNEAEQFDEATDETQGEHGTYQVLADETEGYSIIITSNNYSPILIVNLSHTHDYNGEWQKDDANHYRKCECGNIEYKYAHVYDDDDDASCNDCGYARKIIKPIDPTDPTDTDKQGLSGGAIAGIAVAGAVVLGLGVFAIIWFVIKKKTFADLIAIFKRKSK